jgi:hypothetical protein
LCNKTLADRNRPVVMKNLVKDIDNLSIDEAQPNVDRKALDKSIKAKKHLFDNNKKVNK